MLKFLLAAGILPVSFSCLRAQTVIQGKAMDGSTGAGIGFATVHLLAAADSSLVQGQIADSAGVFTLPGVPAGRYVLQLFAMGYRKAYKNIMPANAAQRLNLGGIALEMEPGRLNEVVINGERPSLRREADRLVLPVSGNKLFAAAANAYDVLKKVPGLVVNGDGTIQLAGRVTPAVFVDGKPVPMSPEELQSYLNSLSPEMIASIELISNPSSRYDGEHKGIIDIRLKRDMTLGWKGTASVNLQQHAYTLADNNLSLSYKRRKIAYTARLGYTGGKRIRRYSALQHLANTNIMATHTTMLTGNSNFNIQLGADYSLHKNHQLALTLRSYQAGQTLGTYNTLFTTDAGGRNVVSDTYSDNNARPGQRSYAASIDYSGRLGKSRLDVQGSLLQIGNRQTEDIQNRERAGDQLLDYWKTALANNIFVRMAQADFSRQLGRGKLGAGARFAFTTTKNDLRYDTLDIAKHFVADSSRTNYFRYDEYVSAAYVLYEETRNRFNYALSLRAEHTHSVADAVAQRQVTRRNYITWLPAINLTYTWQPGRQLHFSYSRRITRPNFNQLNPFRFYLSPRNYFTGNPNLQPSTTDMLQVSYAQPAFSVSLQLGREWSPMARYPEYDSVTNMLEYLGRNLPYNDFAGVEVSFPLRITGWWRMQHNIRGDYKKEQTPYHGVTYAIPITDYTISGSQVFSIPGHVTLDLSYYYRSYSGDGLYIARPTGNIDLGLYKSWLQGRLSTRINFYDMLDTRRVRYIFREKQIIDNRFEHWFGIRKLAVMLAYNFGKSTHKARQDRRQEEEIRAGM